MIFKTVISSMVCGFLPQALFHLFTDDTYNALSNSCYTFSYRRTSLNPSHVICQNLILYNLKLENIYPNIHYTIIYIFMCTPYIYM